MAESITGMLQTVMRRRFPTSVKTAPSTAGLPQREMGYNKHQALINRLLREAVSGDSVADRLDRIEKVIARRSG
jgi:hypothetical protein